MATRTKMKTIENIADFVRKGIDLSRGRAPAEPSPFWQSLRDAGTELWLDTGDIDEATKVWSAEMTALTTNNTLLNKEVQKGIYDDLIKKARKLVSKLEPREQVREIAFILNARHGLRLLQRFGGKVSVELHTDLANDLQGIEQYGRRFHEISPEGFIVKVPLTATGIVGARRLRDQNIPVNFTLEFSARQNLIVAAAARPNYVNVFLGRLGAYVIDNKLGDGKFVGEKATIASHKCVERFTATRDVPTRQIAASLRSGDQVGLLAGVDVFTMPVKVALEARAGLRPPFESKVKEQYPVLLAPGVQTDAVRLDKLWDISDAEMKLANDLDKNAPADGRELVERVRAAGCADIFPALTAEDLKALAAEGKIPKHERWAGRIRSGEVAVDSLLTLAGLASFTADQRQLDERIEGLIRKA